MNLELGSSEFLDLSPRYFDSLVKQLHACRRLVENRQRVTDYLLASIISMIANTSIRGFTEVRNPTEFLPTYPPEAGARRPRRPTAKQLSSNLERTMESAMRYQAAQVERGMTEQIR